MLRVLQLGLSQCLCSTAVQCQAPRESSRLCKRSCGMHVLASLPVRLRQCFFLLPVRLSVSYTDVFPFVCTDFLLLLAQKKQGNKDHLFNQARSDMAKQEPHVEGVTYSGPIPLGPIFFLFRPVLLRPGPFRPGLSTIQSVCCLKASMAEGRRRLHTNITGLHVRLSKKPLGGRPWAVVWKGDPELPPSQQGIKILGIPMGRREYIEHFLDVRVTCRAEFLQRIPLVEDLQCAWLLLLHCWVSWANFYVRSVAPEFSLQFA